MARLPTRSLALVLLLVAAPALPAAAQDLFIETGPDGTITQTEVPAGAFFAALAVGDSAAAVEAVSMDAVVPLIVQFESPPRSRLPAGGVSKGAAEAVFEAERVALRAALAPLEAAGKRPGAWQPAEARIHRDYRTVFNGVALTVRRWAVPHLAALPDVRGIFPDAEVHTLDDETNALVGADRVWEDLGVRGEGVLIAIIDTGIDYMHPDLGGGIGSGFKVAGGYDFFDDDADPMDEHRHGTHVAGIAAADGPALQGVAPAARLLAVRTIGPEGTGRVSMIIAGIEYAVDPDGDPATDDGADVLNLSLGTTGYPTDPLAQAVDNAVAAGAVCVVAAGNQFDYRTVLSPGAAADALTVGATDNTDRMADFSSRGPTLVAYSNKPDLVAPGSSTRSTVLGGHYDRFSGTSMATPHVAGAAALLRQLHPAWPPALVKAVLVQNAVDVHRDVWTQGGGRLDIAAAARAQAALTPSTISLGLLDLGHATITHTDTLRLYNLAAAAQTFTLTIEDLPAAGAAATLSETVVDVPPGGMREVVFTLTLDTDALESAPVEPPQYVGRIRARSATASVTVPFTFVKTPHLLLDLAEGNPEYVLVRRHGGNAYLLDDTILSGLDTYPLPLAEGVFDVLGIFYDPGTPSDDRRVLGLHMNEAVAVTGTTPLTLSPRQRNSIRFRLNDAAGVEMAPDYTLSRLSYNDEQLAVLLGGLFNFDEVLASNFSPAYQLDFVFHTVSHPSGADYVIPFTLGPGLKSTRRTGNSASEFVRADTRVVAGPHTERLTFAQLLYLTEGRPRRVGFLAEAFREAHRLGPPFRRSVFYRRLPGNPPSLRLQGVHYFDTTTQPLGVRDAIVRSRPLYDSLILEAGAGRAIGRRALDPAYVLFDTRAAAFSEVIGAGPPFWIGPLQALAPQPPQATQGTLGVDAAPLAPLFAGPGGEVFRATVAMQVFSGGELVRAVKLSNVASTRGFQLGGFDVGADYEVVFSLGDFPVEGVAATATARLSFHLPEDPALDAHPPTLKSFALHADAALSTLFLPTTTNTITASARDVDADGEFAPVTALELSTRRLGSADAWMPLAATRTGDNYRAAWPATLPDGYYAVRVMARDAHGNTLDYVADPAVRVGVRTAAENTAPTPASLSLPADGFRLDPGLDVLRFSWHPSTDADRDLLGYRLHLAGAGLDTTLAAGTDTALIVTDVSRFLPPASAFTWTVETADGFVVVPAGQAFTLYSAEVTTTPTSVEEPAAELPRAVTLEANYPNPFRDATTLAFVLPEAAAVRLEVFDVLGRRVAVLVEGRLPAGRHRAVWHPHAPSGVYLYRLTTGEAVRTRPMLLVK